MIGDQRNIAHSYIQTSNGKSLFDFQHCATMNRSSQVTQRNSPGDHGQLPLGTLNQFEHRLPMPQDLSAMRGRILFG